MTLADMLAAHNDAALCALASKGLVRRARRDLDAGKAEILAFDTDCSKVTADGQDVTLDARGPVAADCGCPASGVCRHILLAVMALREQDTAGDEDKADRLSAAEEVAALTHAQLRKFAGADWPKALQLKAAGEATEIAVEGLNSVVQLTELQASVTFIAGQGLKGAVFKGPKTRARTLVTLCAIAVRDAAGIAPEPGDAAQLSARPTVAVAFLERAGQTLERAVSAVIPGRSAIAVELLLDLSISTRIESLPRLSAELRTLTRQARQATDRDVAYEPELFLKAAARTRALLAALKAKPADTTLTGSQRRDYQPEAALDLCMLGAARWRSTTGARGLSGYAYSPQTGRWFSVSDGRAAGMDPSFDPFVAYRRTLWGIGAISDAMGKTLHLPAPMVADDGAIALQLEQNAVVQSKRLDRSTLLSTGAATSRWSELRSSLAERFGGGLRRRAVPLPALIAPSGFAGFGFHDLEQTYEWEVLDDSGDKLLLSIPGDDHEIARRLREMRRRISLLLVEATIGPQGLRYRPVAVFENDKTGLSVHNLDFDRPARQRGLAKTLDALSRALSRETEPAGESADALRATVSDTLDAGVAVLSHSPLAKLDALAQRCEASGLLALAAAVRRLDSVRDVTSVLKAAYLAAELEAQLWFQARGA